MTEERKATCCYMLHVYVVAHTKYSVQQTVPRRAKNTKRRRSNEQVRRPNASIAERRPLWATVRVFIHTAAEFYNPKHRAMGDEKTCPTPRERRKQPVPKSGMRNLQLKTLVFHPHTAP